MYKIILLAIAIFFSGCATKETFKNQTALFWHKKIYNDVFINDYNNIDDDLTEMEIEHPSSLFLKNEYLILFNYHLQHQEYILAKFYINEYKKRFANKDEFDWCDYNIIKINYLSFYKPYTNQLKIIKILNDINLFNEKYPNSQYKYYVNTIKTNLLLTQEEFNKQIASLYQKLEKPKAQKFYLQKIPTDLKNIPYNKPYIPWYKKIFYW